MILQIVIIQVQPQEVEEPRAEEQPQIRSRGSRRGGRSRTRRGGLRLEPEEVARLDQYLSERDRRIQVVTYWLVLHHNFTLCDMSSIC